MPGRTSSSAAGSGSAEPVGATGSTDAAGTAGRPHEKLTAGAPAGFLRSRWDILLVIGLGGALGSLARWGVGEALPWSGEEFPWATFIANVSGGYSLGVLMVFLLDVLPPRRYLRPFLGVGLLGGYTTFSTYMLETRELLYSDREITAVAYLGGSLFTGLVAVWLGIGTTRLVIALAQSREGPRVHGSSDDSDRTDPRSSS